MSYIGSPRAFAAGLVLAALWFPISLSARTVGTLTPVDAPPLVVDPAASAFDDGSTVLQFVNDGPAPVPLALTPSEVISTPGKQSGVTVTLHTVTDVAGKIAANIGAVEPGKLVYIRADVQNLLRDGAWDIEIHNQGVKIGAFKLIRSTPSFNVKLDVPKPDAPEMSLEKGVPKLLSFVNGDDQAYPVSWEFALEGKPQIAASPRPRTEKNRPGSGLMLPARGTGQVTFVPPNGWFSFTGMLKDEDADGWLTVRPRRIDCPGQECQSSPDAPARTFKVKLHLAYWSAGLQALWADLLIFFALLVGAAASFGVNLVFPNYVRRRDFLRQLAEFEARIASLPVALSSRLRVLAGIERKSLDEGLGQFSYISLDFKTQIAVLEQSAKLLGNRVDLLQQMGADRIRFEALRAQASPPTLADGIDDLFEELIRNLDSVGISDKALVAAALKVADIEKRMDELRAAGPDFAVQLIKRAKSLTAEFNQDAPKATVGKSATCGRMRQALPGLFDELGVAPDDPKDLPPADFPKWDMILYKLEVIRKYVYWREAGPQRADRVKDFDAIEAELVKRLLLFSWEGFNSARRYVREIEQNIFPEDVAGQLKDKRVQIRKDRFAVRQYAPTQFNLEFDDPAYNTAEARQDWTCTWFFGHGPAKPKGPADATGDDAMREYGWVVTHYFSEPDPYHVEVRFHHRQVQGVPDPDLHLGPREIHVEGVKQRDNPWEQRRIEIIQVLLAVLPAMLGLVAGAKDQLLKLDLIPAAIAIVAIGFGSDQIKNKLTQ